MYKNQDNDPNHNNLAGLEDERRFAPIPTKNVPVQHVYVTDPDDVRLWADLTRQRNVYLMEDITPGLAHETCQTLHWLDRRSRAPVRVWISTAGGEIFAGLAIHDAIAQMRSPTMTIAIGWTASMGAVIFQAGQTRLMAPNAFMMIHEPSTVFAEGSTSKIQDEAQLLRRLQNRSLDILGNRSNLKRKEIEEMLTRKDAWLDAAEAVKFGLADGIFSGNGKKTRRRKGKKS